MWTWHVSSLVIIFPQNLFMQVTFVKIQQHTTHKSSNHARDFVLLFTCTELNVWVQHLYRKPTVHTAKRHNTSPHTMYRSVSWSSLGHWHTRLNTQPLKVQNRLMDSRCSLTDNTCISVTGLTLPKRGFDGRRGHIRIVWSESEAWIWRFPFQTPELSIKLSTGSAHDEYFLKFGPCLCLIWCSN